MIGPLIPPAKPGGNKRTVDVRAVVNGVMGAVAGVVGNRGGVVSGLFNEP